MSMTLIDHGKSLIKPTARWWRGLAVIVFLAATIAISPATAGADAPKSTPILNVPFKGVTTPGSNFDVVQSIVDFQPGAAQQADTFAAPRFLAVLEGQLTVSVAGKDEVVATGKGIAIPPAVPFSVRNEGAVGARAFTVALATPGTSDPAPVADAGTAIAAPKTVYSGRMPFYGMASTLDIVLQGGRYDVGFQTPNHVMNHPHFMTMIEGKTRFSYLDGYSEMFSAGTQAQMHVGRPGYMANDGDTKSAFLVTWLATPGSPLTVPVPVAATTTTPAAPAPPSAGTGLAPADDRLAWPLAVAVLFVLGGAMAVVVGLGQHRPRAPRHPGR